MRPNDTNNSISHAGAGGSWRDSIVGESVEIQRVVDLISRIAVHRTTVLISGETGCGKEVVARAIHDASPRSQRPFVGVNCAAIPRDLIESELFGHVAGAFSGSMGTRVGRFEQAEGGTLFLDEIADMPLEMQAKLLRTLQEREFHRLGSSEAVALDVRFLVATNVDLLKRVRLGRFREDLYYRLHVVPLKLPALRERKADIAPLANHFAAKVAEREGLPLKTLAPNAIETLHRYSWPGNVRQLENAIETAMVISEPRLTLECSDFQMTMDDCAAPIEFASDNLLKLPEEGLDFEKVIGRIELDLLDQALQRSSGNKSVAAEMLKLKRTTLTAKLKALGYSVPGEDGVEARSA